MRGANEANARIRDGCREAGIRGEFSWPRRDEFHLPSCMRAPPLKKWTSGIASGYVTAPGIHAPSLVHPNLRHWCEMPVATIRLQSLDGLSPAMIAALVWLMRGAFAGGATETCARSHASADVPGCGAAMQQDRASLRVGTLRFGQARHRLNRNRDVGRAAAATWDFPPGFDSQRMRAGVGRALGGRDGDVSRAIGIHGTPTEGNGCEDHRRREAATHLPTGGEAADGRAAACRIGSDGMDEQAVDSGSAADWNRKSMN